MFIPWRTWTGRTSSTGISSEKYSISRVCPTCGSVGVKLIGQSITVPFGRDRACVNCGTRYAPRQSKGAGVFFIVVGILIVFPFGFSAVGAAMALLQLHPDKAYQPTIGSVVCPGIIAAVGGWFVHHGARAFRRPSQRRTKRDSHE
jgi:uncharacterized protein (DUF983 family)